jgi:hypothetical protein
MNTDTNQEFLMRLAASRTTGFAGLPMTQRPVGDSQIAGGASGNYNPALLQGGRHFSSNMSASNQGGQSALAMFGQGVSSPNQHAGTSGPNNIRQAPGIERLNSRMQADREEELLLQLLIARRRRQDLHGDQGAPAITENVTGDELLRLRQAGNAAAASSAAMFNAERQANMQPQSIPWSTGRQGAHDILSPYGARRTSGSTMPSNFGQAGGMNMPPAPPYHGMNSQDSSGNLRRGNSGNTAPGTRLPIVDNCIDDYLLSTSRQQYQDAGARQTTGSTMHSNYGRAGGMSMPPAPLFLGMNSQDASGNLRRESPGNTAQGRSPVVDDYLMSTSRQQHHEAMMAGVLTEQQQQQQQQQRTYAQPSRLLGNMTNRPINQHNHMHWDGGEQLRGANKRGFEEFMQNTFNEGDHDTATVDPPKRKRLHKKKPADMPRRSLSAYNLFYSEERERILLEMDPKRAQEKEAEAAAEASEEKNSVASDGGKEAEAAEDGGVGLTENRSKPKAFLRPLLPSQKKRRSHRKTHGKISFQLLAQMVGSRWKALCEEKRKYYQDLAQEDMKRRNLAMEEYYKKQAAVEADAGQASVEADPETGVVVSPDK